ncbi:MAG: redoxin family protein [Epsilonproteobacteria bacterium]|nr:redoxin family protein [Campylobacterota bacterium]
MNKKRLLGYLKEGVFLLVFVTVLANILSLYNARSLSDAPLHIKSFHLIGNINSPVPNDRPIMVHFWGSWCPVCKAEADNIDRLSKYYEVVTVAVNSGDDATLKKYLQEHNLHYKVVNDQGGIFAKSFNIQAFPTTFIYDKKGELVFKEVGYTSTLALWMRLLWAEIK